MNAREMFEKYAPRMVVLQPELCDILGPGDDDNDWRYPGAQGGRQLRLSNVPCRKEALTAQESMTASRTGAQYTSKFMIPLGTVVNDSDYIRYKGELYPVTGVLKSTLELETTVFVGDGESE